MTMAGVAITRYLTASSGAWARSTILSARSGRSLRSDSITSTANALADSHFPHPGAVSSSISMVIPSARAIAGRAGPLQR